MKGILGTKIGMTRIFDNKGISIPVTVIHVEKCWVVGKKTKDKHGYEALQLGYKELVDRKATKPQKGIVKNLPQDAVVKSIPYIIQEIRDAENFDTYVLGQEIKADLFKAGEYVDVQGTSKGKGFAGVMKRHGFGGLDASHGHGEYRRAPGAMSASSYPSRVFKGKKLPGHMGDVTKTVQKLEVVEVNPEDNLILIKGAVPGSNGTYITIKQTVKSKKFKKVVEAPKSKEVKLQKKR
jgi:large subunit ribosomal protein L3